MSRVTYFLLDVEQDLVHRVVEHDHQFVRLAALVEELLRLDRVDDQIVLALAQQERGLSNTNAIRVHFQDTFEYLWICDSFVIKKQNN
jgi:hypothetical protein